jgi:hypothetical protein
MDILRPRRLRLLCLAVALSVAAGGALAVDDVGQSRFSTLSLEELLRAKVSVASQTEEQVRAAPSSATVFTRSCGRPDRELPPVAPEPEPDRDLAGHQRTPACPGLVRHR